MTYTNSHIEKITRTKPKKQLANSEKSSYACNKPGEKGWKREDYKRKAFD